MNEQYSIEAILSAVDQGFTKAMSSAKGIIGGMTGAVGNATKGIGSFTKSMIGAQVIGNAISGALGAVKNGFEEMIGEMNSSNKAWKTFEGNLEMIGKSKAEIKAAQQSMQDYATKTIYSASDMASTFAQMTAIGVEDANSLVKGIGGIAASAENPKQAMKSLSQQMTQALSKPELTWADFKIMLEQAPAGMAAVAKDMGYSLDEFVGAVQDGTITSKAFADSVAKVGNNAQFQKMATEFKSVDQAMDGLKEGLSNKLLPAFQVLNKFGIRMVEKLSNALEGIDFGALASKLQMYLIRIEVWFQNGVRAAKKFFGEFVDTGALNSIKAAFGSLKDALGNLFKALGLPPGLGSDFTGLGTIIGNVVKKIADAIKVVSDFIAKLDPGLVKKFGIGILGAVGAMKGFKIAKRVGGWFKVFKKNPLESLPGALGKGGGIIKSVFTGIADVIKGLGKTFEGFGKGLGAGAKGIGEGLGAVLKGLGAGLKAAGAWNILAFAAGIALVIATLALLATQGEGVKKILEGIGNAFGTIITAVGTAVGSIIESIGTAFGNAAPGIEALGTAIAIAAPAIAEGIAIIVDAIGRNATPIAEGMAIIVDAFGNAASKIIDSASKLLHEVPAILDSLGGALLSTGIGLGIAAAGVGLGVGLALKLGGSGLKDAAEGLGQFVKDGATAGKTLIDAGGGILESAGKTVGNVLEGALKGAGGFVESAARGLGDAVSKGLNAAKDLIKQIGDSFKQAADAVGANSEKFGKGITDFANAMEKMQGLGWQDIIGGMKLLGEAVDNFSYTGEFMSQMGTGFKDMADGLVGIESALEPAKTAITNLDSHVNDRFNSMLTDTQTKTASIAEEFKNKFGEIETEIQSKMNAIFRAVATKTASMQTDVQSKMTAILMSWTVGMVAITLANSTGWNAIQNEVSNAMSRIVNHIVNGGTGMNTAFMVAMTQMNLTAISMTNELVNIFDGLRAKLYTSGQNAGQGFNDGLESKRGTILNTALSIAKATAETIDKGLDINSPSGVTWDSGEETMNGFGGGMLKRGSWVVGVASNIAENVGYAMDSVKSSINGMNASINATISAPSRMTVDHTSQSSRVDMLIAKVEELIEITAQGKQLVLDTGVVAGGTQGYIDKGLRKEADIRGRLAW